MSDNTTEYPTGSHRDCKIGKGRYDLLPPDALHLLALHFEAGCLKYDDRNWEIGIPLSSYLDSADRHLHQCVAGLTTEDHAVASCWNLLCYLATRERIISGSLPPSLNDMPTPYYNRHPHIPTLCVFQCDRCHASRPILRIFHPCRHVLCGSCIQYILNDQCPICIGPTVPKGHPAQ